MENKEGSFGGSWLHRSGSDGCSSVRGFLASSSSIRGRRVGAGGGLEVSWWLFPVTFSPEKGEKRSVFGGCVMGLVWRLFGWWFELGLVGNGLGLGVVYVGCLVVLSGGFGVGFWWRFGGGAPAWRVVVWLFSDSELVELQKWGFPTVVLWWQ
ncbi:uncharacterized protein LOC125860917 isoform X1 [Solanum stenotomum]|uniref:uncharacterized protein LOC125860917 isoform X1 n=1 Tax=Solanum stenotomum TaxID=172797 RepID=UPI0020D09B10|nr:uncharacterized protein LOC125860917 isoform X1 [Solanum stenotomum]